MFTDKMRQLDVTLYGNVEQISPTLSKCRLRIFYRGLNRNRTFITDEFANELVESLPYAPVKGIFNFEDVDYQGHGDKNTEGRIYGIVPYNTGFAWEKHLDDDGIEREYACSDVILYTGLYPEAKLIPGKSQSMEIHRDGLRGEWKINKEDGQPFYEFYHGHLLGLQVLGDSTEPCFQGSAFFSLMEDAKELVDYVKGDNQTKKEDEQMNKNIFNLSESEKCEMLWNALNGEADNGKIVCDIQETYALVYDSNENKYTRVAYSIEENVAVLGEITECSVKDFSTEEVSEYESMKTLGTYEEVSAKMEQYSATIDSLTAEKENMSAEIETYKTQKAEDDEKKAQTENELTECKTTISDYENQISEKDAEIVRLNSLNGDISNENTELKEFKLQIEADQKKAILDEFSAHLTEEQAENFTNTMADYSVADFKKEVCTAAYDADPTMFSKKDADSMYYVGGGKSTAQSGILKILADYKGGNK